MMEYKRAEMREFVEELYNEFGNDYRVVDRFFERFGTEVVVDTEFIVSDFSNEKIWCGETGREVLDKVVADDEIEDMDVNDIRKLIA